MFREAKKLHEYMMTRRAGREQGIILDNDGNAVIEVGVNDLDALLSDYCTPSRPVLDGALAEFLENHVKGMPKQPRIAVNVTSKEDFSQALVDTALVNYYDDKLIETKQHLRRNGWATALMAMFGALVLALALLLNAQGVVGNVLFEILDIIAWVLLWEATDKFLFERNLLKLSFVVYCRLSLAKVTVNAPLSLDNGAVSDGKTDATLDTGRVADASQHTE